MAENSRGMIFRKRNVLGAALAAGIGLGIYLGQFKGFGLGGSGSFGIGGKGETNVSLETPDSKSPDSSDSSKEIDESDLPKEIPDVVRVVIDDRQFLLRGKDESSGEKPISLKSLIELVKKAPGDKDGFRIKIYEKSNARMKEEESLKEALMAAGIDGTAILWVPLSVK